MGFYKLRANASWKIKKKKEKTHTQHSRSLWNLLTSMKTKETAGMSVFLVSLVRLLNLYLEVTETKKCHWDCQNSTFFNYSSNDNAFETNMHNGPKITLSFTSFFLMSLIQITVGQYRLITNMFRPLIKFRLGLSSQGQWLQIDEVAEVAGWWLIQV